MKLKASALRTLSVLVFVAITILGLAYKTGSGTLSTFGYKTISLICPLGYFEAMLASRSLLPRALVSFIIVVVFVVILGRVYCAWICPVPLLRRWIVGSPKTNGNGSAEDVAPSELHPQTRPSRVVLDSRHAVLGGALLSTAIFGFPVFCLICPIGLTFATLIGLWRLIQFNEPTWTLLIFPAVLVLELVVVRKWCRKICPLGALLSLLSGLNVFVRPKIDESKCLRSANGANCKLCKNSCMEEIDLHHGNESQPLSECTKCRECSDVCPVHAITFPLFKKKGENGSC